MRAPRFASAALALLLLPALAAAVDRFNITATRKTVSQSKGTEQDLPRGKSRSVEKDVVYRFDIQCLAAQAPGSASAEWMVVVEGAGGRFFPGTMGQKGVELAPGRPATIETEPITLVGREWRGGPSPGTVEDTIAGYGIRLLGSDGSLLAEKYDPSSVKSRIDWKLLQEPRRPAGARGAMRRQGMPPDAGEMDDGELPMR